MAWPTAQWLLWWLLPFVAVAELNFQQVILDPSYIAYERDVGDIDGDGDNDLVAIQEGDTTLQVFRAPNWTRSTLITFTGTYRYPRADDFKLADIDGDGDLDIVTRLGNAPSSDTAGIAVWCENLGGGSSFTQHLIGNSLEYVKDIVVADFDRDHRPDVAMRMDRRTQLWLQEPSGTWTEVLLTHPAHEGMEAGDLDMDGDPDLILNGFWFATPNSPAAARLALNYTNKVIDAAWFNQTGDWTANSCKVVVGDFDGDGTNDAAFSQSERAGYAVAWYRSSTPNGARPWTKQSVAVVDYCHSLQAADWDLDGDVDLLVGGMTQSQHRGLKLLLNAGAGTNWTEFIIQTDGSYSAETGDIDNDGDLDIVGIRNWNSAPTCIYRNNAGGGPSLDFWFYHQVSAAHVRTFGLCFPDVDGDGDLDIASGPFVYLNPGPPMTNTWTQIPLPNGVHAFATLDLDGDNLADLVAQKGNSSANRIDLYWVEAANATGTVWSAPILVGNVPRSDHLEGFQGYRVAQIVADGQPEIAVSTMQGIHYFALPAANPNAGNWPRTFVAANDSDEGIGVADMDGDGDQDISFTSGGSKQVKWARNPGDGSGNWSVFTIGSFPEADWPDRCDAADLNGDGRVDIVATEENSGGIADALACWWEQPMTGATNTNWPRRTIATQYTLNNLDVADLDRDGDPDLVLAEHRGTKRIAVWENDGLGAFVERRVGQGRESHLGGRTVDLDGDGDLDLVSIAYDDFTKLHLWRNDSPSDVPTVARPVVSPNGGVFDETLSVTLACATIEAQVWFTTTGAEPTNQPPSFLYSNTPIPVAASLTLKARGFKTDLQPSPIAIASFVGPKVRTPILAPPGGTFSATQSVTMSCATTNATIRFTTSGADPQDSDLAYSGVLVVTNTTTVKARAFRPGLMPSDVAEGAFTLFRQGAVAHWRLDERFGTMAADSSGNGHAGTVVGAVWTAGQRDNALRFDGVDDHVECGTWDVAGTAMTMGAWVKLDPAFVDNDARILSKAVGSQEQDHWWMLSTATSSGERRLRVRLKAGGSTTTLIAGASNLVLDAWHHVAASYDGATLKLFVNGVQVGSTPKTGNLEANPSAAIWIGANPPASYAPFRGLIDDVRIYNTAMDAAGVSAVMNDTPRKLPPRAMRLEPATNGVWSLLAEGSPGHYLHLQRATNLPAAEWESLATQALSSPTILLHDSNLLPRAFYRLWMD
jgi:hypothetical protein